MYLYYFSLFATLILLRLISVRTMYSLRSLLLCALAALSERCFISFIFYPLVGARVHVVPSSW